MNIDAYRRRPPHNILYVDGQPGVANLPLFPYKLLGEEVRLKQPSWH